MKYLVNVFVLGLGLAGRLQAAEVPGPFVLRNCSILDVARGEMLPGRTVVLSGGKIQAIGTREAPIVVPSGASTIEAEGNF